MNDVKPEYKVRTAPAYDPMIYGKMPPQAREMEESVLGALMIQSEAYDQVADLLQPAMFYVEAHQKVFQAMKDLALKSQPLDINTVSEQLRSMGELEKIGGIYYVSKLTNSVVSAAHITAHSRIIVQKHILRELIKVGGNVIQEAYEDMADPFAVLDRVETWFSLIGQQLSFGDMVPIQTVLVNAIRQIEEWRQWNLKHDSNVTGVASGFSDLDNVTRGWQKGDLIIIAARPSVGKTAFALNVVRNAADYFLMRNTGQSIAVWSLEMKSTLLMIRMLAAESREVLMRIQTGRLTEEDMKSLYRKGVQVLAKMHIYFDDIPGLSIQKLRSKARRLKAKNKLGLIVVDYLQLMTPEGKSGNREQEVSKISRNLKLLAQELDVPIIALSQMSREFEKRKENKSPQNSDLRESGSLEQDADVIIFLWEPMEAEILQDASLLNRRYLKVTKQRNGLLVKIDLNFRNEIQLFNEISKIPELGAGNFRPMASVDFTESTKKDQDYE